MGIILALIFAVIAITALVKLKGKPGHIKAILIIVALLLLSIQVLFLSMALFIGMLEYIIISALLAIAGLTLIFKRHKKNDETIDRKQSI
jgi:hypothetical protein